MRNSQTTTANRIRAPRPNARNVRPTLERLETRTLLSVLVQYDFTGELGTQAATAADYVAPNITATPVTRGAGVTASAGANTMNSSGWTISASLNTTDYYSFGVWTVQPGYTMDLQYLYYADRSDADGPFDYALRYSRNGFATYTTYNTGAYPTTAVGHHKLYLLNASEFQDLTGPIEFRLYGYNSNSSAGQLSIQNNTASTPPVPGLVLEGTISGANSPPTNINLSNDTLAENLPAGTTVGILNTVDPDVANTFTYSLVAGSGSTDNALFTISGNSLKTAAPLNYESKSAYTVRLRTTDQGGLWYERPWTIHAINLVEQAPVISGISDDTGVPGDYITSDRTLLIDGAAEPGMTVTLYRNGSEIGTRVANASGQWSFDHTTTSLPDASYSFTATATDSQDNVSALSSPYSVTVDGTAPLPTITAPANGGYVTTPLPTISGFAGIANGDLTSVTIKVYAGNSATGTPLQTVTTTADALTGAYSVASPTLLPLFHGQYTIQASQSDAAGNSGNSTAATFTVFTMPGDANNDGTVSFSDFVILANNFGQPTTTGPAAGDFNGDGSVTFSDFVILANHFGQTALSMIATNAAQPITTAVDPNPGITATPTVQPEVLQRAAPITTVVAPPADVVPAPLSATTPVLKVRTVRPASASVQAPTPAIHKRALRPAPVTGRINVSRNGKADVAQKIDVHEKVRFLG